MCGISFAGLLAAHDLGSEKEVLSLFLGKGSLVRGPDKMRADQTYQRADDKLLPPLTNCVHSSSPQIIPTIYPP